ncbi:DUF2344 domain-containing protein [Crassaminicella thermophila]|uniref:DUF2344 domain-containing protein n=1 Tax=Crassaminicella thermophila TaxID=2599308 RepID=A0A5C0SCN9_CRATE|nr:TIGR03936 family radical SAM-associated protein [Crassaminicella thermophila]QEK12295.1 DUF2344 domain-containing protein [Crassaminicella thermophila]
MYKVRMRFSKNGYMIFISHLDLVRMVERVLRRANIPIAFTQGFNPHPKISFATALALGVSSDGEYIDIEIQEKIDLSILKNRINEQLPDGIKIIKCKYIDVKSKALMAIVEQSKYMVRCSLKNDVSEELLRREILNFMRNEEILMHKIIKKKNKEKKKEINIRPLIKNLEFVSKDHLQCIFSMIVATGSKGNLKPEVVIEKLIEKTEIPILLQKIRIHRLELYGVIDGELVTPFEITR